MKPWLLLEELAELLFSIYLFSQLPFAWWLYPLLFFTPDVSLIAMAAGQHLGEKVYNIIHHKGLAISLFVLGTGLSTPALALVGLILLGHACFDRMMGLGFKHGDTFTHAHLRWFNLGVPHTS